MRRFSTDTVALVTRKLLQKIDKTKGNPGLIETVDGFLAENDEKLWEILGFASKTRPGRLFSVLRDSNMAQVKFLRQKPARNVPSSPAHLNFLRALYPLNRQSASDLGLRNPNKPNYDEVNHLKLALAYENLPKPRPLQMNTEDLERLLAQFTSFRNFLRPNLISKLFDFSQVSQVGVIIKKSRQMFEIRRNYVSALTMIIDDLKESGIPLTNKEKMVLIELMFFRDHEGILKKIARRLDELGSNSGKEHFDLILAKEQNKFTEQTYEQLVQQFEPLSTSTLNLFLRSATSWNDETLIKRVVLDIKSPNYTTYRHLLFHYSLVLDSKQFFYYLEEYLKSDEVVDTKMVNVIQLGYLKLGYEFFGLQIIRHLLTPKSDIYRQLLAQDRAKYNDYLLVYLNIRELMPIPPFEVSADATTFKSIIDTFCLKRAYRDDMGQEVPLTFSGLLGVVDMMESSGIPLNSQMYGAIFSRFLQPEDPFLGRDSDTVDPFSRAVGPAHGPVSDPAAWDLAGLNYFVGRLLYAHDTLYTLSDDSNVKRNLHRLQLAPELEHFINHMLPAGPLTGVAPTPVPPGPTEIRPPPGANVKLSGQLVATITAAYLQQPISAVQSKEIIAMKTQLDYDIETLRTQQSPLRSPQLDSIYYCRKTYLLRLLECTLV